MRECELCFTDYKVRDWRLFGRELLNQIGPRNNWYMEAVPAEKFFFAKESMYKNGRNDQIAQNIKCIEFADAGVCI